MGCFQDVGQTHAGGAGDGAVAGKAERAAGVIDGEKHRRVRVDFLYVRIVATRALDVSVDEPHGARRVRRGRRIGGQLGNQVWSSMQRKDEADRMGRGEVGTIHIRGTHLAGHRNLAVSDGGAGRSRNRAVVATQAEGAVRAQRRRWVYLVNQSRTTVDGICLDA